MQEGDERYTPDKLKPLHWGLRFIPAACSLIAAYGLYNRQPWVLFTVAIVVELSLLVFQAIVIFTPVCTLSWM